MGIEGGLSGIIVYVFLIALPLVAFLWIRLFKPNNKTVLFVFWSLALLFTLVEVLRYGVGKDYLVPYEQDFEMLKEGANLRYEPLFLGLNKIVGFVGGDIVLLMGICSCVIVPLFFRYIRKNVDQKYWFFAIFLFIGTTVFFATMNVVRQYLAISVLLFVFDYLVSGKYFRYVVAIIIATLFHTSALIVVPFFLYYIAYKKCNRKVMLRIIIAVYIVSLVAIFIDMREVFKLISFIVPNKYDSYWASSFFNNRNWLAAAKLVIPNLIFLVCLKHHNELEKYNARFGVSFVAWFFYIIISNAFYGVNVFIRLGWYFDYFALVLIPIIVSFFESTKSTVNVGRLKLKKSSVLITVFVVYYISLDVYGIFIKGGHGVVPYKTVWMK